MSGTRAPKAQEMIAGVRPARAEQRKTPEGTSAAAEHSFTSTSLGVPSTAGSPSKTAEYALCCCRRGEQSQPKRSRHERRASSRSAVWQSRCARGHSAAEWHHASQSACRTLDLGTSLPRLVRLEAGQLTKPKPALEQSKMRSSFSSHLYSLSQRLQGLSSLDEVCSDWST